MKNRFIYILTLLLIGNYYSKAQSQAKVITLSNPEYTPSAYVARDAIFLKPGFSFTSTNGTFTGRIDESLVFNADYLLTSIIPDSTKIITSCPVGFTQGSANVSPTGAANYQIPIYTPEGIAGVQPSMSIIYNSQSISSSILGVGWNLSGLSAITRVPRTIYSDGVGGGINFNSTDRYALDGNRLLALNNATYGAQNTNYETEVKTFSKIESFGLIQDSYFLGLIKKDTGPSWFKVTTKDGKVIEYGNSSDSKVVPGNYSAPYIWLINKITDANGNFMTLKYKKLNGEVAIEAIEYTKNGSNPPSNSMLFFYDIKSDKKTNYISGRAIDNAFLLRKIKCITEGTSVRTYNLGYYVKDEKTYLNLVTEIGCDNKALNSTAIGWGDNNKEIIVTNPNIDNSINDYDYRFPYDFDSDGITDLVCIKFGETSESGATENHEATIFKSSFSNGNYSFTKLSPSYYFWGNYFYADDYFSAQMNLSLVSINGTSKKVFWPSYHSPSTGSMNRPFIMFFYGISSFMESPISVNKDMPIYTSGDFDNDGKDEVIYFEKIKKNGVFPGKYINNFDNDLLESIPNFNLSLNTKPERLFSFDFTNDGLLDLMIVNSEGYYLYQNQGGNAIDRFVQVQSSTLFNSSYSQIEPGDFNGDGLVDFLLNEHCSSVWHLATNNGYWGFNITNLPIITAREESFTDRNNDNDRCIVSDFNHDGKSDVIIIDAVYNRDHNNWGDEWGVFQRFDVIWYLSTGSDFSIHKSLVSSDGNYSYIKDIATGDFDGDGKEDLLNFGSDLYGGVTNDDSYRIYSTFNSVNPKFDGSLVNSISDGLHNITKFTYQPINYKTSATDNFYTKGTTSTYPLKDILEPLYCIKTINVPNGTGGVSTTNNTYEKARVQLTGKGFLGFSVQTAVNTNSNRKVVTTTELEDANYLPKKQTTSIYLATGGLLSSTENNYTNIKGGNSYFSYINKNTSKDYVTNNTTTTTYNYINDTEGNLYRVKADNGDGLWKETLYENYFTAGSWILNKPQRVTSSQKHLDHSVPFNSTTVFQYNATTGNITSEVSNSGSGKEVTTTYSQFDQWGHPISIKTEALSEGGNYANTKTIVYDNKGRYIKSISDISGTESTEYDPVNLTLLSSTGINGLKTSYSYDAWGKLTETRLPDGSVIKNSITWGNTKVATEPLFYIKAETSGKPWVKTGYDAMGRVIAEETIGFNELNIFSETKYNQKGEVVLKTSKSGGNIVRQIEYSYFDDGRIKSILYNGGKSVQYSQEFGKIVTEKINGYDYVKTYDSWGNIKSIVEPSDGGTINYTYHSNGKPKSIDYPGATVQMDYDPLGNQITLTDPSSGNLTYRYDALGRLTYQKDARGNETTLFYDEQSRLLDKKTASGTVAHYEYYTSGIEKGKVKKVSNNVNFSWDSYEYDEFGRQKKATTHIDETIADIVFQNHYDDKGNVDQITYPGNYLVTQRYDGYGNLIEVKGGGSTIWALNTLNESSMKYVLGNGQITEKSFDSNGLLKSIVTSNGSTQAQKLYYIFDAAKGLMQSREDQRSGYNLLESFGYDHINRLTSWTVKKNGLITNSYSLIFDNDTISNIAQKTGVGTYRYNGSCYGETHPNSGLFPHALKYVVPDASNYSPQTQNLTYTDFGKVKSINENGYALNITYDAGEQRVKSVLTNGGSTVYTNYYAGLYEVKKAADGSTKEYFYIPTGDGISAVLIKSSSSSSLYYIHKDHLGSIVCITNSTGGIAEQINYDPWGRYRNYEYWNFSNVQTPTLLTRGFTGHEHLNEFGLINMNGRVYDPILGMFISPDNNIQAPDFSQNFNRYSYCLNNPLSYNDPTGEFWHIIIGAVIGGVVNLATNWDNCDGFWEYATAFGVGAGAGAVTALTGGAGAGFWATAGVSALSSAVTTGTNTVIAQTGKNFSGMDNVDWGQVGINSGIGGLSGFAGSSAGQYAAKFSMINGINSPVLKSLAVSPIAAGAGHVTGGTAVGLLQGKSFGEAWENSFNGIGKSMALGTAVGVTSTVSACFANGMNPLNGKMMWPKNNGFQNDPNTTFLKKGEMIDRYGDERGRFASPNGTSFDERSLPPNYKTKDLNLYRVIKPIPVLKGISSPSFWFNSSGGGTQYQFFNNIEWYTQNGYLLKVTP